MTQLLIDRATLEQLIESLETCSPGDYSTGYVIHPSFDAKAVDAAITAGRAALANAEPDTTQRDAELWRAYKARKDAVINAGMVSKVMRTGPTEYMKVQDTL